MRNKKLVVGLFVFGLAVLIAGYLGATIGSPSNPPQPEFIPGEVLLKFKPSAATAQIGNIKVQLGAQTLHRFHSQAEHWKLRPGLDVGQAIAALRSSGLVEYAEPNYVIKLNVVPNDPRMNELWGLVNTGQSGGTNDADIDADLAWNVSTGSPSIVVASIDTGIDYNHPDLAANVWTNPGEIPGNNIDDDHNGFVDDVHGYDFINNDGDPFDDNGHGTHTSGTIGAVGNNGIGVAGVNWNIKIMSAKFLSAGGSGSTADAVRAVDYTTMMGVALTSNSWGGGGFSQTLYDAIANAGAHNVAFIASAGNNGANSDTSPSYPAAYDLPNIISVAATDRNDQLASFSNYGPVSVDLAAPGVDVLSTLPGNSYGLLSGTSMACPHVSGVYALIKSVSSPGISVAQIKQVLMNSVDHIPAMAGKCVSNGRLNAFFAIAEPDTTPPGMINDLATTDPGSNTMGLTWTATGDDGGTGTASYYEVRYSTSTITTGNWSSATRAGGEPAPGPAGTSEAMEVRGLAASTSYYFAVKAFDEWGNPGPLSNIATGSTLPPPTGQVAPTSVSDNLLTGQQSDHTVLLSNVGDGTLDFSIPSPALGSPQSQNPFLDLGKDVQDPRHGDPVTNGSGGPDTFGYRWTDSDQPGGPGFAWTDISGTGTAVGITGDDDTSDPIALGFNMPFYGTLFGSIQVCTNGWLSFTSTATSYSNQPLPNSGAPENLIAPFWDDQDAISGGQVFFQSFGNRAIVQWNAIPHHTSGGPYTYQAILEANGTITFQYYAMGSPVDSATIGIQNAAKTIGLQTAFNQAYVHNNLAVRINAIPQWLTVTPISGRLHAGESKPLNLHMNASGLEGGTYPGTVNILTNDPVYPTLVVNAALHVIGAPDAVVQPSSIAFGDSFIGQPNTQTLIVANDGTDTLHVTSIGSTSPSLTAVPNAFNVPPHGSQNVTVTWTPPGLGAFSGTLTVNSDDAGQPSIPVSVTGNGIATPIMIVSPTSYSETLFSGNVLTRPLHVTNTGGSSLVVDAAANLGNGELVFADDVGTNGAGGPDAFGYRWKDSDASGGPSFSFADISATGTTISFSSQDDAISATIPMGMTFPHYGQNFTSLKVSTNGWLTFDTTDTSSRNSNTTLPNASGARNMIAMFWDDLHLRTGNVKYLNDGTRFIVQYTHVGRFTPSTGSDYTFQVQLYPNGKILLEFGTMTSTVLNSATIGTQNNARTIGLQVVAQTGSGTPYVHNNLANQISRTPDWLAITPSHQTIPPGGNFDFTVTFDSNERNGGDLIGSLELTTNIPGPEHQKSIPATLHVVGAPIASIVPASFAYGTRFTGYSYLTSFQVVNTGTDVLNVTDVFSDDPNLHVEDTDRQGDENTPEAAFPLAPGAARIFNLRWAPPSPASLNAHVHVVSDDPVNHDRQMAVTGTAILPPIAAWSPASFSENANVGDVLHRTLHVANDGGSPLSFDSFISLNQGAALPNHPALKLDKDEIDPTPGILGSGGPDVFGYRWADSDAAGGPVFSWVDITGIGTPLTALNADDQNVQGIPLGFNFPFYGTNFNTLNVCSNGWVSFTSTSTALTNSALPSTGAPFNMIAPFWDDLSFSSTHGSGQAFTYTDGNRFILSFINVPHYPTTGTGPYTFQVILYRSGRIVYQYLSMGVTLDSATIGMQNATGTDGLNVVFNTAYMHNNLAVEMRPPGGWLSVTPGSGSIPAHSAVDLDVLFDATGLIGGTYTANIDFSTNDPANGSIRVPASLHVTGIPDIDAVPSSLSFATTYLGYSRTLSTQIKNVGTDALTLTGSSISGDFSVSGLATPTTIPVGGSVTAQVTFAPTAAGPRSGTLQVASSDPDEPTISIPLSGNGLVPPEMHVTPPTVSTFLPPTSTTTRTVQVCNTGGSDLHWTSGTQIISGGSAEQHAGASLGKDEIDPSPGILGAGGPDVFGYRWRDSDEPGGPVFSWVDITGIGTPITALDADDEVVNGIPIGFSFPFYGGSFSTLNVSSNGWMSPTYSGSSSLLTNAALPSSSGADNMLAGFWDDLSFSSTHGSGRAYYYNDGTRFILSFVNVPHYPTTGTGPYTFQYILYPNGRIVYQYLSVGPTQNSATIGIQNAAKTDGLTVVFNQNYVHNGLAVEIKAIPRWVIASPTGGTVVAGACQDVTLAIDSTDLAHGGHDSTVSIHATDDPYLASQDVAVHLTVNRKPVAEAGSPQTLECTGSGGASATLNGTGSTDGDLDPLTYAWTAPGVTFDNASSATPTGVFHLGTTTASLTVNDGYEDSDPDTVSVTVADTTPPTIVCPTVAAAECQSANQALVTLAAATAADTCGGVTITNDHNAGGANASGSYPLGTTVVTFTATDGVGRTASCQSSVTVVDTIPPTLSATATPDLLWPPNHRMADVDFDVVATDACDPNPTVVLVSVTSTEADDMPGNGDGSTTQDVQGASTGTADFQMQLRAERDGKGAGRTYTATYRATDHSGNTTSATDDVSVPHDLGNVVEPIDLRVNGKTSTTITWPAVFGAVHYDVVRGNLSALHISGSDVLMGTVTCIERESLDTTTAGHEDAAIPAPGQAWFYAVQFFDGVADSSYGSESTGKARVVQGGDCP